MIGAVVFSALQTPELQAIWGTRVYPTTFMQKDGGLPQFPAARYSIIDSVSAGTICGTDDRDTDDTRVQVDIAADTFREVNEIVDLVITSMQSSDPPSTRESTRFVFDEETRTHRAIVDFIFYPSSALAS